MEHATWQGTSCIWMHCRMAMQLLFLQMTISCIWKNLRWPLWDRKNIWLWQQRQNRSEESEPVTHRSTMIIILVRTVKQMTLQFFMTGQKVRRFITHIKAVFMLSRLLPLAEPFGRTSIMMATWRRTKPALAACQLPWNSLTGMVHSGINSQMVR